MNPPIDNDKNINKDNEEYSIKNNSINDKNTINHDLIKYFINDIENHILNLLGLTHPLRWTAINYFEDRNQVIQINLHPSKTNNLQKIDHT
jgi:hypothetical protein